MQVIVDTKQQNNSLAEFSELMNEVAKLSEKERNIVAIYSQGVLAMAQAQNTER
jgi:hypothetical protein